MGNADPYSKLLRQYFVNPAHAAELPAAYTDIRTADASESGHGASVRLMLAQQEGRIQAMRFRAWGCPHLIAAAEAVCEQFEGRPVETLADFEPQELMQRLAVPVEKTGRILLLQDALRSLQVAAGGREPGN